MDLKSLKKLAELCRKVGIKTFKNADMEFTLSDDVAPVSRASRKDNAKAPVVESNEDVVTNSLTEEEMLFWSSAPHSESN